MSSSRLALAIILGPTMALLNQGAVYAVTVSSCGHPAAPVVHVIPAFCLIVALAAGGFAARTHRANRHAIPDDPGAASRARFMAATAIGAAALSSAVVVAQWAAIFTFSPCMRS